MKRSIALWQLLGFGVTSLLGTLLHFLYDLLGKSPLIASFSGVNESTWEHMKLLFWPMLIFAIVESLLFKDRDDFFNVKLRGILLGLILIPILFYTYNGVIGKSPDFVNIAIFFVSAAISYIYEARLLKGEKPSARLQNPLCGHLLQLQHSLSSSPLKRLKSEFSKTLLQGSLGYKISINPN